MKLDKDNYLVDESGKRIEVDGKPVKIEGAVAQDEMDRIIQERLAREQANHARLKAAAEKVPELQRAVEDSKAEIQRLEALAAKAKDAAEQEFARQVAQERERAARLEQDLEQERQARMRENLTNQIVSVSGARFLRPVDDVVPRMLASHKRKPARDADGKVIEGKFEDIYEVAVKDEKGQVSKKELPLEKAIEAFAADADNAHYLRPNGPGAGGGRYNDSQTNQQQQPGTLAYPSMK